MPIAVRAEVEATLAGFTSRIRDILDRAMEDWIALPNKGWLIWPRDRSTIIFSYISRRAMEEFARDPEIRVMPESQTVKFLFRDTVLARFKKGNARGVGSNVQTQANLDFVDPQLSFAGLPDVHRVEIVYDFDILGTGYNEVAVVARDRRERIWAYPLRNRPSGEIIQMPPRSPLVLTPPAVTPKVPVDKRDTDDHQKE